MQHESSLFQEAIRVLFRHKKKVIAFSFTVLGLTFLFILFGPRTYESEGRVFIRIGRESVALDPTATTGETVMVQSSHSSEIQSAIDVLRSRGLHERVVEVLGPRVVLGYEPVNKTTGSSAKKRTSFSVMSIIGPAIDMVKSVDPISQQEEAIQVVKSCLSVEAEIDSSVVALTYAAETPDLAKAVVDTLLAEFETEHVRINRIEGSGDFFDDQVKRLEQEYADAGEALSEAKNGLGLSSIDERLQTIESAFRTVKNQIVTKRTELADASAILKDLQLRIEAEEPRVKSEDISAPNTGADLMQAEYFKLKLRQLELSKTVTANHPERKIIDQQIAEAEQALGKQEATRQQTTEDVNPVHQELRLQYLRQQGLVEGLKANLAELQAQEGSLQEEQVELNIVANRLDRLQIAHDQSRSNLISYKSRLEQTRLDKDLERQKVSNTNIVHNGTLSEDPVSPKKALMAAAAILLSISGSIALAFGFEMLDTTVKSAREIKEDFGIPILAVVPKQDKHFLTSVHGGKTGLMLVDRKQ